MLLAESDQVYFRDTLARARQTGRTGLVETVTDNGPPPYRDALRYEPVLAHEADVYPYDDSVTTRASAASPRTRS